MEDSFTGIVDVGSKPIIAREAVATGVLRLSPSLDIVKNGRSVKGDVRASTVAAIQAVKKTYVFSLIVTLYQLKDAQSIGLSLMNF